MDQIGGAPGVYTTPPLAGQAQPAQGSPPLSPRAQPQLCPPRITTIAPVKFLKPVNPKP